MSMFSKPQVDVSFSADAPEPQIIDEPQYAFWAHTPARRVALVFVLAGLCILAFAPPLVFAEFLPGDAQTIEQNSALYSWQGFGTIWLTPQHLPQVSPVAYSFALIQRMTFGENSRGYRIICLGLHIANVLLLYLLLQRLELPGAWLGAALFAVHPVQVDTVTWISQQRYLICGVFYLSAILIYLRRVGLNPLPPPPLPGTEPLIRFALPQGPGWLYTLTIGLLVFALLSHPLAATFPLIVLILIWWERGTVSRNDILPLIAPILLSLALLSSLVVIDVRHTQHIWVNFDAARWMIYEGRGVWSAFLMVVLPIGLSFAHARWDHIPFHPWQMIFPLSAAFILIALWVLRHRYGRGAFTAALLFCVMLLPAAMGVNDGGDLPGALLQEHALYLACAAILAPLAVLAVDSILTRPQRFAILMRPGIGATVAVLFTTAIAVGTDVHSGSYESAKSVWEQALQGDGDPVIAHNSLGELALAAKEYGTAEKHFRDALIADPTQTQAMFNLARVAETQDDLVRAISIYYQIIRLTPDDWLAHLDLAEAYVAQGDVRSGLAEYEAVRRLNPTSSELYNNLGLLYAKDGENNKAIENYRKSILMDSHSTAAYLNLANLQFQSGKFMDARDSLENAAKVDPHNYVIWMNAGVMATTVGDLESGERYFRAAIYYNPTNVDAYIDLATVLLRASDVPGKKSRVNEAIGYLKRALVLDPKNGSAASLLSASEQRHSQELNQNAR